MMRQMRVRPTHPGKILQWEYLEPAEITQSELADHIGVDFKTINRLINGHTSVTPAMAQKLGQALNTSPQLWLNLQAQVDLFDASQLERIEPMACFRV